MYVLLLFYLLQISYRLTTEESYKILHLRLLLEISWVLLTNRKTGDYLCADLSVCPLPLLKQTYSGCLSTRVVSGCHTQFLKSIVEIHRSMYSFPAISEQQVSPFAGVFLNNYNFTSTSSLRFSTFIVLVLFKNDNAMIKTCVPVILALFLRVLFWLSHFCRTVCRRFIIIGPSELLSGIVFPFECSLHIRSPAGNLLLFVPFTMPPMRHGLLCMSSLRYIFQHFELPTSILSLDWNLHRVCGKYLIRFSPLQSLLPDFPSSFWCRHVETAIDMTKFEAIFILTSLLPALFCCFAWSKSCQELSSWS